MSDFFAEVERELRAATARRAHLPWYRRHTLRKAGSPARLRIGAIALAAVFATTAAALAASGVILTGSPVRPVGHPVPTVGEGVPAAGGTRLLPLRAPDPAGGLPWGMRVVHATRGLVCVQIGRIDNGRLGELGVDGAFGDDGRFHPLPADALPDVLSSTGGIGNSDCEMPEQSFAGDIVGLQLNAASDPPPGVGAGADRREISFGLLGPNAVKIAYRSGSTVRTQPVLPGLGAYLIVQRVTSGRRLGSTSDTDGSNLPYPHGFPASPNGALTTITYRYAGKLCADDGSGPIARLCGLSESPPPHAPPPSVHEPLRVHLQIHGRVIAGAEVSFPAPYSVSSANQSYFLTARTCRGLGGSGSEADVARGATVRISVEPLLSSACTRSVTVAVRYTRVVNGIPESTPVGTVTIHEPPGTHAPPLPRRAPIPRLRSPAAHR
jgi:hypothetical protein